MKRYVNYSKKDAEFSLYMYLTRIGIIRSSHITVRFILDGDTTIYFDTTKGYIVDEFFVDIWDIEDMNKITIPATRDNLIKKGIIKEDNNEQETEEETVY